MWVMTFVESGRTIGAPGAIGRVRWTREDRSMLVAMSGAGWFGLGLLGLIIWVAIAFWPARVARRKGHSWLLFFIFSLFFFPAALIVAYLVRDRRVVLAYR
jgi:hypothetical protein